MTTSIDEETTYEITRGDADDILVTFIDREDDGVSVPERVDLSKSTDGVADRPAVLRYAVKQRVTDPNSAALFIKRSYDTTEIVRMPQTGDTLGQAVVYIDNPDTAGRKVASYWWDFEVTRQGTLRTGAQGGTFTADGSATVVGVGTTFTKAKAGDVLHPLSGADTGLPVLVLEVLSATSMVLDRPMAAGAGVTFELRRGFRKTPLRGPFKIGAEVIQ